MGHGAQAVRGLCEVSAREMRQLQGQIQQLEDVVLTVLERGSAPSGKELRALQDFDLVVQTLAGLAGFYDRLGQSSGASDNAGLAEAAAAVPLQRLRERLTGSAGYAAE